jgi:serine/threonine protein kinase
MSPEQARGLTVDRRADIWAFGCCLYEALTASRVFDAEDVSLTLAADYTPLSAGKGFIMVTEGVEPRGFTVITNLGSWLRERER